MTYIQLAFVLLYRSAVQTKKSKKPTTCLSAPSDPQKRKRTNACDRKSNNSSVKYSLCRSIRRPR